MKDEEIVTALREIAELQSRSVEDVNVIDYAWMNENAHTNFLEALLNHRRGDAQVFVRSFLKRMLDIDSLGENCDVDCQVTIENNRRSDMVIKSKSFYIVVENKVCGAIDGDSQVADYWRHVVENSAGRRGYLVYLTLAGGAPATWSADDKQLKLMGASFVERSYKHDVLDWLLEDVLPNCLVMEKFLIKSIELYMAHIARMAGAIPAGDAEKMWRCLPIEFREYRELKVLKEKASLLGANDKHVSENALRGLLAIENWMVDSCVYCDQYATAYNLKWILRNNPTLRYKYAPKIELGLFSSVSIFTYYGDKYVGCKANIKGVMVEIHIHCSESGLKHGPYLLDSVFECGVSEQQLLDAGFTKGGRNRPTVCPMADFDIDKTDLVDLSQHIAMMAAKVQSILGCKN